MVGEELKPVIDALTELEEDSTIPKNTRAKIAEILNSLKESSELSIKVNKAFNALDEISNDSNLPSYIRTQIWGIVSLLEKV